MADEITRVAIAVVEREGWYLVGTRPDGAELAGRAEFPGGKCLPGEESSACAVRECREETGLAVLPVRRLYDCLHEYPHGTLELNFWLCRLDSSNRTPPIVPGWEWMPAQTLRSLCFPAANAPVVEMLAAGRRSMS